MWSCRSRGGCAPPSRRRGVNECEAKIMQRYRTRQSSREVGDSRVTTRGQVLLVEGDMLGDDGFAISVPNYSLYSRFLHPTYFTFKPLSLASR